MLDDGTLVVYYSDETDPQHNCQKIMASRSADGVHWGVPIPVVAIDDQRARPGMANVRRTAAGFAMTYELCEADGCAVH